jgi:hypothetical protein
MTAVGICCRPSRPLSHYAAGYIGLSTSSWADQSESATTMTTQAVIVGRGGALLTWDGRL